MRKALLLSLMCILGLLCTVQHIKAQSSPQDSLRRLLVYFGDSTKDEKLKQAVKAAQVLYTSDRINDSLSSKLLDIEDLLEKNLQLNRLLLLSYYETLPNLLQQLPPKGEHPDYFYSIFKLALIYKRIGQYEKALPLLKECLTFYKRKSGGENSDYATVSHYLAFLYKDMGQYEKALPLYEQELTVIKKLSGEENPNYATALNNIATLYRDIGQYEKTLPIYQKALTIYKKVSGEEDPDYAACLSNIATFYSMMGHYEKAVPLFQQALKIKKKVSGEEHPNFAAVLRHLAITYSNMGQHEKALPLYEKTLAILEKSLGKEHPYYAYTLIPLASSYWSMNQYEKALPLVHQALDITKKTLGEEHSDNAVILNVLAFLYKDMGQYEESLPLYEQALSVRKKALGEEHPDYAESLNNLGLFYTTLGKDTAAALLIRANNITLQHLSRTYSTLSEQEKMIYLNKEAARFDFLPSLLYLQGTTQPNVVTQHYQYELALKGKVLEDQKSILNSIRRNKDSTALQLYKQWHFNKAFLGQQLLVPLAKRVPSIDSIEDATTQLEQQLSRSSATFRSQLQSQSITVKDIAQKLEKGEAAVEFIHFSLYNKKQTDSVMYAALVLLPQDTIAHFVPLFEKKQLQRLLTRPVKADEYDAIHHLYGHKSKALGDSLYQLVWHPLEQYFTGVNTVYYAPAGLLHRVSFQALGSNADQLLVDKYRLNRVLSTRSVVVPVEVTSRPKTATLWGNIQYTISPTAAKSNTSSRTKGINRTNADTTLSAFALYTEDTRGLLGEEWEPLPFTKSEMDSLRNLFTKANIPITTLSGTTATEEAFKALDGDSPQVLNLGTHGFFLPVKERKTKDSDRNGSNTFAVQQNPMFRSGLVLAGGNSAWKGEPGVPGKEDGILTAYEIAQMDLSGTDLVVLSACETALGDLQGNEGVIGLQRAFKMAGVKQMIVSLWQVPEKATAELMTSFYRNWLGGQSTREALRNAQLKLKLKQKYKEPFFWAAFVLVE